MKKTTGPGNLSNLSNTVFLKTIIIVCSFILGFLFSTGLWFSLHEFFHLVHVPPMCHAMQSLFMQTVRRINIEILGVKGFLKC